MNAFVSESAKYVLSDPTVVGLLGLATVLLASLVWQALRKAKEGPAVEIVGKHPWLAILFVATVVLGLAGRWWAILMLVAGAAVFSWFFPRPKRHARRLAVLAIGILAVAALFAQAAYERRARHARTVYVVLSFAPKGAALRQTPDAAWTVLANTFHQMFDGIRRVDIRPTPIDSTTYAQFGDAVPREEKARQLRNLAADVALKSRVNVTPVDPQRAHVILYVTLLRLTDDGRLEETGQSVRAAGADTELELLSVRAAHDFIDKVEPGQLTTEEQQAVRQNVFAWVRADFEAEGNRTLSAAAAEVERQGLTRERLNALISMASPDTTSGDAEESEQKQRKAAMARLKAAK